MKRSIGILVAALCLAAASGAWAQSLSDYARSAQSTGTTSASGTGATSAGGSSQTGQTGAAMGSLSQSSATALPGLSFQGQTDGAAATQSAAQLAERALLAYTSPDYPVTPGDVYMLTFLRSATPDSVNLIVASDYTVNMSVFGTVSARGQTFEQFRRSVERLVSAAYAGSSPQLLIKSTGVFQVVRSGETRMAGEYGAWGLQRLSSLYEASRTPYSSPRDVLVRSADGTERRYDLFMAQRYGDLSQDPYLKPGDRVTIARYTRAVTVNGAVHRPGTYYLLPGDDLTRVLEQYADGFVADSDPSRILITRIVGAASDIGQHLSVAYAPGVAVDLHNEDILDVPAMSELRPVCWFEGAIGLKPDSVALDTSNKFPLVFLPGMRLSKAVMSIRDMFSSVSDLESSYLERGQERRPIDISVFLYEKSFLNDVILEPGDRIVVPFKQLFVNVSGAVKNPGRYPYIPDRSWDYYIYLAGGFDIDRNSKQAITIVDRNSVQYGKERMPQPEDTIVAKPNSFLYQFSRVAQILTTVISAGTLTVAILNYTN